MTRVFPASMNAWRVAIAGALAGVFAALVPANDGLAAAPPVVNLADVLICDGAAENGGAPDFDDSACAPATFHGADPQRRWIWLRARVTVDDPVPARALLVSALAAREIYINGTLLARDGRPAPTRAGETPGPLDSRHDIPPGLLGAGENLVALRLSAWNNLILVHAPLHRVWIAPARIGKFPDPAYYTPALIACGALILGAIYFAGAYLRAPREIAPLLVALAALFAVGQLAAETARAFFSLPYPAQVPRLILVALCAFGFALSLALYAARRFAPARARVYIALAAAPALCVAPFAPGFDSKALAALFFPLLAALLAAFDGARAERPGAAAAMVAFGLFLGAMFGDGASFLDGAFYLAALGLLLILYVDQLVALEESRRAAAAFSARATALELELIKRRIAPHFLMNALNALAEWAARDAKTAVRMIDALAGEFRLLSQMSGRALVPLSEEIALCRLHLDVMSFRADRPFSLETSGVDETRRVPPCLLHALVENAFSHGRYEKGAVFRLREEKDAEGGVRLLLETPAPDAPRMRSGGGEGETYVRRRLDAAFGAAARLSSGPAAEGGWRSEITLPAVAAEPA